MSVFANILWASGWIVVALVFIWIIEIQSKLQATLIEMKWSNRIWGRNAEITPLYISKWVPLWKVSSGRWVIFGKIWLVHADLPVPTHKFVTMRKDEMVVLKLKKNCSEFVRGEDDGE